ncbi:hypothetical protein SNEBB_007872 [Seison nebaliae]|nr:hypothetical protein SNEBB_007872 [Seison nebaliae]
MIFKRYYARSAQRTLKNLKYNFEYSNKDISSEINSNSVIIKHNFLSDEEAENLFSEINPSIRRLRYETNHWDDAIHRYREMEKSTFSNPTNQSTIKRLRDFLKHYSDTKLLDHCHIIDLDKDGYIKPHIDSIRFCGNCLASISLLSDSVLRLRKEDRWSKIYLPRNSVYLIRKEARDEYTHEILDDKLSYINGEHIRRDRRLSIICRCEPEDQHKPPSESNCDCEGTSSSP